MGEITPVSPISRCPRIPQSGQGRAAGCPAGRSAGAACGQSLGRVWPAARPALFTRWPAAFSAWPAGRPAGRWLCHPASPLASRRHSHHSVRTLESRAGRLARGRPAGAPRPPWLAARPSAGPIRAGPNLSLAGRWQRVEPPGWPLGRGWPARSFRPGRPGGRPRPDFAAGASRCGTGRAAGRSPDRADSTTYRTPVPSPRY